MKILHTSDLHLQSVGDSRWSALTTLLDHADDWNCSVVSISGDLFDDNVDAEALRSDLRSCFSGNPFEVVMISGNHDADAYRDGLHFGEDVSLITNHTEPIEFSDQQLRFWGLPYDDLDHESVYSRIQTVSNLIPRDDYTNCLMYHGQIIHPEYRTKDFGEESEQKYMPVYLDYFEDSGLDYVLAGHYHRSSRCHSFETGYFLYSGTPVPTTQTELGPRSVFLVESPRQYETRQVNVPYYESLDVVLRPEDSRSPLEKVEDRLESLESLAQPLITVRGFFDGEALEVTESELNLKLKERLLNDDKSEYYNFEAMDVSGLVKSDLYREFEQKVQEREFKDSIETERLKTFALEAMIRVRQ